MQLTRGDVVLTRFPHAAGRRGKRRPAVVIQSDQYNSRAWWYVVAQITTNLGEANDPAYLLIDVATPDGRASGLQSNSLVSCVLLTTLAQELLGTPIGHLSPALLHKLDACLRVALQLP